jgi:tetratricopeptide (TPR) repeat protein
MEQQEAHYLKIGNQFREEKKLSQAIQSYLEVLELNPDSISGLIELSKTYNLDKDFDKASSLYLRIVQLEPKNSLIRTEFAETLMKLGYIQEAIATYLKALALPNPHLQAYRSLIKALKKTENFEEATALYHSFLSKDSKFSLLFHSQIIDLGADFIAKVLFKIKRININFWTFFRYPNQEVYVQIWQGLNQVDLELFPLKWASSQHFPKFPKEIDQYQVSNYFKQRSSYRTINSSCLSNKDISYIDSAGLSLEYLNLNKSGIINKNSIIEELKDSEVSQENKVSDQKIQFQFTAIEDRCIYAICPKSGKILESNCSFVTRSNDTQYIFYRFVGDEVFYIATGRQWLGFPKVCIYFPKTDFIFFFDNVYLREEDEITDLKICMVTDWENVISYITTKKNKKLAILINWNHFAHSVWNELSGIYRLVEKMYVETGDNFPFLVVAEPFGELGNIFPKIPKNRLKSTSKKILKKDIFQNNYFINRVGYDFIQEDLVTQIHQISTQKCTPAFLAMIEEVRRRHFPLVWISIRIGDRTWASQTEGIIQIVSQLFKGFPTLGVVLDGFSLQNGYSCNYQLIETIRRETDVVQAIIASIPKQLKVYDTIGCMLYQSLVWANNVDFYIAHHGTIQHKIGWFANKPGIVHSNKSVAISEKKYYENPNIIRPAAGVRENCILPIYIDEKYITDIDNNVLDRNIEERRTDLNNYEIDWRVIYRKSLEISQSLLNSR